MTNREEKDFDDEGWLTDDDRAILREAFLRRPKKEPEPPPSPLSVEPLLSKRKALKTRTGETAARSGGAISAETRAEVAELIRNSTPPVR